jgi:hypothetical protein
VDNKRRPFSPASITARRSVRYWERCGMRFRHVPRTIQGLVFMRRMATSPYSEQHILADRGNLLIGAAVKTINDHIQILLFEIFDLLWRYAALIGSYRRFGTTYRSHLQRSLRKQRCVTSQKSEDLIYTAAEAWNHASYYLTSCLLWGATNQPVQRAAGG